MKQLFFAFLFCFSFVANFAMKKQDPFLKHKVLKGETVFQIAKQYQVTPLDIYQINPTAKDGIQENSVLLIPNSKKKTTTAIKHKVQAKETLYSISKKYAISVADLEKWNKEELKNGLKEGQELLVNASINEVKPIVAKPNQTLPSQPKEIPNKESKPKSVEVAIKQEKNTVPQSDTHLVLTGETKYGIATKYNLTVEKLEQLNPEIASGLKVGATIIVSTSKINNEKPTLLNGIYEVQAKETLFSICKKFNISEEELYHLNPEIGNGLKEGMLLTIPEGKKQNKFTYTAKNSSNLLSSVDKTQPKELVLLLPFNIRKIENDSLKSKSEYLKSNKFLNLTLDFYAGAMMAIDSAKTLGLPLKVKIFDVESTKSSTNVASIISKNDFSNVDAIIGPFQSAHVDVVAQILERNAIPVISPLSKERGLQTSNLYYAIPSEQLLKKNLFAYFKYKNGNVIAFVSSKKETSKNYITTNYPETKIATFTDKGAIDIPNLKSQLVKGKPNFIILEIEKTGTILSITNTLKSLQKEYDLQLVVFEVFDALNFDEIPIKNLSALKMMYPSANKIVATPEELIFVKKFKKENNMIPNSAAIKGFDVTFDTILRICQEEGFAASAKKHKTEYIENSFDYTNTDDPNQNNGSFLLYYDTDLTIKKVQ